MPSGSASETKGTFYLVDRAPPFRREGDSMEWRKRALSGIEADPASRLGRRSLKSPAKFPIKPSSPSLRRLVIGE